MRNFDKIEEQLENIIATMCNILETEKQERLHIDFIEQLLDKREQQLQTLYQSELDKHQLTEKQRETLRSFFNRFYVLDKKMSRLFNKLSLRYQSSLHEIKEHKRAAQAYEAGSSKSMLFNARISG